MQKQYQKNHFPRMPSEIQFWIAVTFHSVELFPDTVRHSLLSTWVQRFQKMEKIRSFSCIEEKIQVRIERTGSRKLLLFSNFLLHFAQPRTNWIHYFFYDSIAFLTLLHWMDELARFGPGKRRLNCNERYINKPQKRAYYSQVWIRSTKKSPSSFSTVAS